MTECRPIRQGEEEEFLSVLCGVFDLDTDRARIVFYNEPFFDLDRKWGLFEAGKMVSILTTTPLEFGWGPAVGIAGVATLPEARSKGLAGRLVDECLRAAGEPALLFAERTRVYERAGFKVLDEVVRCDIQVQEDQQETDVLATTEVHDLYAAWAEQDIDRLRRDERRWRYWEWVSRPCEPFSGGYICHEAMLCREAIVYGSHDSWPVMPGSQWVGLRTMVARANVPAGPPLHELWLMGRDVPRVPQMFMTDQF
ncbi:MAG: GNAT family N-acetyltransferase [Armatimonadetes bacterium]|nr:GNAT family N-acetyltransferase [Armatimonadota bacterium]